jgi:hypothetical protein
VVIDAVKAESDASLKVNDVKAAARDAKAVIVTTTVDADHRTTVNAPEKHQRREASKYAGKGLDGCYNPYSVHRRLPLNNEGAIVALRAIT